MLVTVIIPTYNDYDRLSLCLAALSGQTFARGEFEIIVANNLPGDMPPVGMVLPENCRLVEAPYGGSYAARNVALGLAEGEIIGFTDSDCIPNRDWILHAVSFFDANPHLSRIAGNIDLFYKSDKLTPAELYEKVYAFKQDYTAERFQSAVTGNMFARKRVFDAIGGFDEQMLSGGDHAWGQRAEAAGFKIGFAGHVTVKHPARSEMKQLVQKARRVAGKVLVTRPGIKRMLMDFPAILRPPLRDYSIFLSRYGNGLGRKEKIVVAATRYYLRWVEYIEAWRVLGEKQAGRL